MKKNQPLPKYLKEVIVEANQIAKDIGLDPYTTVFEIVSHEELNEIAAYGGFPTRYPHWRWGMEYERLSKSYTYGLSVIYEMVINNDPCYAYLLESNNAATQKTVVSHVLGHSDFFKNNFWFSKTNRKMLDQTANNAASIKKIINEIGYENVENFIDQCLSIENMIDIHKPFSTKNSTEEISQKKDLNSQSKQKHYMDKFIKSEYDAKIQYNIKDSKSKTNKYIQEPDQDILGFLVNHAPLKNWETKILDIIRDEAYYFAPQRQTKILNEGWATYWHSKMMTELSPLDASEIIEYCDQYSGIVFNSPGQLNPYRIGLELLRHIHNRWETGKFGIEYLNCNDLGKKKNWNKPSKLGTKKIFEIRKTHNDITFLDEFFDEDFCHQTKLFLYDLDPRTGKHVVSTRSFKDIKSQLMKQMTNQGQPIIKIKDSNYKNRHELLLYHYFEGIELKFDFTIETLKNLYKFWKRPVHIDTCLENINRRITFDGSNHNIEKI